MLSTTAASAASDLEIGRMRVALWPEYDDPGILVIYDGRFVDEGAFPAETVFLLPKGAVISDACSLSPKGQHFCQLYKQKQAGDHEEVRLKLPYPNFYLSFHLPPYWGKGETRKWTETVRIGHRIRTLEVDIQEPLRAEGFRVLPEADKVEEEKGLRHHRYAFSGKSPGALIPFEIGYRKGDDRPSVDIKYSPMSARPADKTKGAAPHEERGQFMTLLYALAGGGLLVVFSLLWTLLGRGRK